MKRIFLSAACALLCSSLMAQDDEHPQYSVSGGLLGAVNLTKFNVSNNNAGLKYESKAGWSAGGWVNIPLTHRFSIEPQLMYSSYSYLTNSTTPELLNDGKLKFISLPLLLKIHAGDKLAFSLGPQVDFLTAVDDERNLADKSDFNSTSLSVFGGLEVFPHGKVSIFGRYIHGLSNMADADHSSTTEYKNQNIQLGLKLRLFGKKTTPYRAADPPPPVVIPDSDGDGINDNEDKCPNQPGLAKYNGCPVPDSDGDGINDELDKCPNQAGLAKYDGCPIPDSDGDGINDELDKCPNQAGVAKYDGCPIPDKDGDGINDDEDKCPDIAGLSSNNGCPEVPANVSKSLGASAQGISFGATNAKLTTKSYASLDQVVRMMNENPGLQIRIEGHTDNAGDDDANMKLSEDRAIAVKDYLISKGISENRITTEGFGETQPIADNNTASGRMKNRRIELRVAY
ncbi:hypothetical protein CAP36_11850 [Chitinophagaceae bacterium IBVUCB2]|nr:hypothetical protein CAP36_11850 [Chitinophagaceae bacterium IBVUCB2]